MNKKERFVKDLLKQNKKRAQYTDRFLIIVMLLSLLAPTLIFSSVLDGLYEALIGIVIVVLSLAYLYYLSEKASELEDFYKKWGIYETYDKYLKTYKIKNSFYKRRIKVTQVLRFSYIILVSVMLIWTLYGFIHLRKVSTFSLLIFIVAIISIIVFDYASSKDISSLKDKRNEIIQKYNLNTNGDEE